MSRQIRYVICYDIPNDSTRNRLARLLSAEGNRVQYSVFECDLTDSQFNRLLKRIQGLIDVEADLVTAYPLSATSRKGQVRLGSLRRANRGEVVC